MKKVFQHLKDKLTTQEYTALELAVKNYKADAPSYFKVCLTARINVLKARDELLALRKNIKSIDVLCDYISAVKTVYLTERNQLQNKECAYDVEGDVYMLKLAMLTATVNSHLIASASKEKNAFKICKLIRLFSDLRFFACEANVDKSVFENNLKSLEKKFSSLPVSSSYALCPLYLSLYPLEKAEELVGNFESAFKAIKLNSQNAGEIVFWSEKGLSVYGYSEQCEILRKWAIEKFMEGDKRFTPSLISEIIINN